MSPSPIVQQILPSGLPIRAVSEGFQGDNNRREVMIMRIEEIQRVGFYVLFTGKGKVPHTIDIKVGAHGASKGRLLRAAQYHARTPRKLKRGMDTFITLYERGYSKAEVLEYQPNVGAKKIGVSFLLQAAE